MVPYIVIKTTVYLPEELKRTLAAMAEATGRSEAELVRESLLALTQNFERPRPRVGSLPDRAMHYRATPTNPWVSSANASDARLRYKWTARILRPRRA